MKENIETLLSLDFMQDFESVLNQTIHEIPDDLFSTLKEGMDEMKLSMFSAERLGVSIVVDTSILFQEVRSIAINGSSFLQKLAKSPFVRFYGPSRLKTEIHEKIRTKFPENKATKGLDIDFCISIANELLSMIELNDDHSEEALRQARAAIGNRDPNDVDFVSLGFSVNAHAIVTNDNDMGDSADVRTWNLKDTGRAVTVMKKGTIGFFVAGYGGYGIAALVYWFASFVWTAFLTLVQVLLRLLVLGVSAMASLPPWFLLGIGVLVIFALCIDNIREGIGELIVEIGDRLKSFYTAFKDFMAVFGDAVKEFWNSAQPALEVMGKLFIHQVAQAAVMIDTLEQLEAERMGVSSET